MAIDENIGQRVAPRGTLSGPRLDRLPISRFHKRIFWLVGAGMFFDGYDLYVGTKYWVQRWRADFPHSLRTHSSYR